MQATAWNLVDSDNRDRPDGESPYTSFELGHFMTLLRTEWQRVDENLRGLKRNLLFCSSSAGDEGDFASSVAEQERVSRLLERERAKLAQIEWAMKKIPAGTFGICEETGEVIARRRLVAAPWTRCCVAAIEEEERLARERRRRGILSD